MVSIRRGNPMEVASSAVTPWRRGNQKDHFDPFDFDGSGWQRMAADDKHCTKRTCSATNDYVQFWTRFRSRHN